MVGRRQFARSGQTFWQSGFRLHCWEKSKGQELSCLPAELTRRSTQRSDHRTGRPPSSPGNDLGFGDVNAGRKELPSAILPLTAFGRKRALADGFSLSHQIQRRFVRLRHHDGAQGGVYVEIERGQGLPVRRSGRRSSLDKLLPRLECCPPDRCTSGDRFHEELTDIVRLPIALVWAIGDGRTREKAIGFVGQIGIEQSHLRDGWGHSIEVATVTAFRCNDRALMDLSLDVTCIHRGRILFGSACGLAIELGGSIRSMTIKEMGEAAQLRWLPFVVSGG